MTDNTILRCQTTRNISYKWRLLMAFLTLVVSVISTSTLACDPQLALNCPPDDDPQSYVDGLLVQINGVVSAPPPCEPISRISWEWGDGNVSDSFFPAPHTYTEYKNYLVTASVLDAGDNVLISDSCSVEIPSPCKGGVGTDDIVIEYQDPDFYKSDDIVDCTTTGSITLGPQITIPDGAVFNLIASRVSIETEVEALLGSQLRIFSGMRPLNDTGIVDCSNYDTNNLACPVATHPGQDAEYGRDVTHNDDSDGHAGFSFTKLDANGNLLPPSATSWSCVKDNVTGLVWEVKTDDGGLQDKDNIYTWYNPDSSNNGGDPGVQDGGNCVGSDCDTLGYVSAVKSQGLCGSNDDWRMPTKKELQSIPSRDRYLPAIDTDYYPNTVSWGYWSASPYAANSDHAWPIYFDRGDSYYYYHNKSHVFHVRLVRDGQ